MTKKRNENIRKSCQQLDVLIDFLHREIISDEMARQMKKITHRIKRTTWRGKKEQSKCEERGIINVKVVTGSNSSLTLKKPLLTSFCPICLDTGTAEKMSKHKCRGYKCLKVKNTNEHPPATDW